MANTPRKSAKPKKPKREKDAEQSSRFIETARKLGADESGEAFDKFIQKILPLKKKKN